MDENIRTKAYHILMSFNDAQLDAFIKVFTGMNPSDREDVRLRMYKLREIFDKLEEEKEV